VIKKSSSLNETKRQHNDSTAVTQKTKQRNDVMIEKEKLIEWDKEKTTCEKELLIERDKETT
jgi:hypothetical protein